jgi:4-carboxymuconolactone decarboxylase
MTGEQTRDSVAGRRARADEMRRRVLSDEYVDAANANQSGADDPFQDFLLDGPWSVWTRPGLALRDRSLTTLAMTAALGRMEEFALHCRSATRVGVTDSELDELLLQIAAYCGAPAGVSARRVLAAVRRGAPERDPSQ